MTVLSGRRGAEAELCPNGQDTEIFDQESYPNLRGLGERMKLSNDAACDAGIALEEFQNLRRRILDRAHLRGRTDHGKMISLQAQQKKVTFSEPRRRKGREDRSGDCGVRGEETRLRDMI